ncbi:MULTISPECIES: four-carbon acid sugar kinase family protein [unclassified Streptomyces]|uniref:four-carbon acid sugar kinase family protein n=1 Tax=unclassified Streptomyces TaxID=2593676 RepID=UPI0036BF0CC1
MPLPAPASPSRVAVLADDLTSAGDGAAPFRRAGHPARVMLAGTDLGGVAEESGVLAVDLGSRLLDEAAAVARTRGAARVFAGADLVFKTVDSTLRGHVAAELRAAREASGRRAVLVAPAFPAEGRTTIAGVQYVHGVRVDVSDFARDPVHPVRTADLTRLLPEAVLVEPDGPAGTDTSAERDRRVGDDSAGRRTGPGADGLPGRAGHAGPQGWAHGDGHAGQARPERALRGEGPAGLDALPGLLAAGGLVVCSAATDADLDRIVAAVPDPRDVLWVGSPGLAAALARRHPRTPAVPPGRLPAAARPLIAVGSANPATRRQLARLSAEPGTAAAVADDPETAAGKLRAAQAPVRILHTPDERHADPDELTARLASAAARLAAGEGVDGLVLTGGATAEAVLRALGVHGVHLHDEPEPGVARGTLLAPAPEGAPVPARVPVLIKAGGFGDEDTLLRLCALLRAGGQDSR